MGAAAVPIAIVAISALGQGIEMNQQKKAAEGAANAADDQQKKVDRQIADQKAKDTADLNNRASTARGTQAGALAAIRAAMSANTGFGGTILGSPQGTQSTVGVPNAGKTLLGN